MLCPRFANFLRVEKVLKSLACRRGSLSIEYAFRLPFPIAFRARERGFRAFRGENPHFPIDAFPLHPSTLSTYFTL